MQLNEMLEANSIEAVSKKTNIDKDALKLLFAGDFSTFKKTTALGFISIVEREYHADLNLLRAQAHDYYAQYKEPKPKQKLKIAAVHQKRGKSKWFLIAVFGILVYVSWYFFVQFDKKHFKNILPFVENKISQEEAAKDVETTDELSIETVIASALKEKAVKENHDVSAIGAEEENETQTNEMNETNETQAP